MTHPADDFLAALGKQRATFQTFRDADTGPAPRILHGPHRAHARTLEQLNEAGDGIFIMVNAGNLQGRRTENVTAVTAYFADMDGVPLLNVWPQPPTVIIESSPGRYHVYWRVTGASLNSFERVQKHLALLIGSDPKVCDLPRVMRLPGYQHRKAEPFTTRILELHPERIYTDTEFIETLCLPPEPKPLPKAVQAYIDMHRKARDKKAAPANGKPEDGLARITNRIRLAPDGNRNDTLYRLACALSNDVKAGKLQRDTVEAELMIAASDAGLPDHEATATIHSALRHAS